MVEVAHYSAQVESAVTPWPPALTVAGGCFFCPIIWMHRSQLPISSKEAGVDRNLVYRRQCEPGISARGPHVDTIACSFLTEAPATVPLLRSSVAPPGGGARVERT